jgi:hypothetical protein
MPAWRPYGAFDATDIEGEATMRHPFRKAVASIAVAAGAAGAWAGTAYASNGNTGANTSLSTVKAKASTAISTRLSSLGSAVSTVNANKWLTSSDKAAALAILNNDTTGLTALRTKVQADTTVSTAVSDYRTIFTGYRVYVLALPQIRLAAASDHLSTGVLPRLTKAQSRLESLLSGKDRSKDTSTVQAAMSDLAKRIQAIGQGTNGLSATLLAYTPAQYDANTSLLVPARTSLKTARGDAKTARQDIATVIKALR